MLEPAFIQDLNDRPSEELREIIAHAAGIHAHRDGDNGEKMSEALARIACRLRLQPRKATA
jgi:hypothetical protein